MSIITKWLLFNSIITIIIKLQYDSKNLQCARTLATTNCLLPIKLRKMTTNTRRTSKDQHWFMLQQAYSSNRLTLV